MQVYLDACSLQRPLDDRSQPRINDEAEAVLTVLGLVESGQIELLCSEALQFEIDLIPEAERRESANEILKLASQTMKLVDEIQMQAENFLQSGLKPMDALHLAFANWAKVDYFCTSDDKLLKKSKRLKNLATKVVSPLQLLAEVTP
jgi:predicted nucleic acid-binding protein